MLPTLNVIDNMFMGRMEAKKRDTFLAQDGTIDPAIPFQNWFGT